MSVGTLALAQAADRWDPEKGSIYQWSRRWITTALTKAVDAARLIRLPSDVANEAAHVALRISDAEQRAGRSLTREERRDVAGSRPTFDQLPLVATSLDRPVVGDDSEATIEEVYDDPDGQDVSEIVERQELIETIRRALAELDDVEQAVLLARFSLNGEDRETLSALGDRFGVSAEAMRRIEATALAKLGHPALVAKIDGLL